MSYALYGSRAANRDDALAQLLRFLIRASAAPPEGGPGAVKRHRGATAGQEKSPPAMKNPRLVSCRSGIEKRTAFSARELASSAWPAEQG